MMNGQMLMHAATASVLVCSTTQALAQDNDVQWDLLSHETQYDLRPLVPMDGESFDVQLFSDRDDLTNARVGYWVDGSFVGWVDATNSGLQGPKDVWSATIPSGIS